MADIEAAPVPQPVELGANPRTAMKSLKIELKTWERDFFTKNNRKPTKDDIMAERAIAKKYKQYGKLKAQFNEVGDSVMNLAGSNMNLSEAINIPPGKSQKLPPIQLTSSEPANTDDTKTTELNKNTAIFPTNTQTVQLSPGPVAAAEEAANELLIPEILRKPSIPFRSNHPLLANLSFVPKPDENAGSKVAHASAAPSPRNSVKVSKPVAELDMFKRIPKDVVLRCKVVRHEGMPTTTFDLVNEANGQVILTAKRKAGFGIEFEVYEKDNLCVEIHGKKRSFTIHDARETKEDAPNISAVHYEKATLPRELKCIIKGPSTPEDYKDHHTANLLQDLKDNVGINNLILKSRKPTHNAAANLYSLNFSGRVTVPSIKNFQLADDSDNLILQFGRTQDQEFALDAFFPLTPVEAFSIALTSFEHKSVG